MTAIAELPVGFADSVLSAQSTFRSVMDAMARPGSVLRVTVSVGAPPRLMRGTAAIALTLFDHDTPIWLDRRLSETDDVTKWLKFHSGAPVIADPLTCSFALVSDVASLPSLDRFGFGRSEYPDRSTTLIVEVDSLEQGIKYELRGPGIDGSVTLCATVEIKELFEQLTINAALFPRGIDVVLVADDLLVAIPRTTRCVGWGG